MKANPRIMALVEYVRFTTHRLVRSLAEHRTRLLCLSLLACAFCPATLDAGQHEPLRTASARPEPKPAAGAEKSKEAPKPVPLPLLPSGVTELKFSEFFTFPVGPRGLELTDTLKQLNGRRVRILGYMVRQESSIPGRFLLTPFPAHQALDSCLVDDVPPCKLEVSAAGRTDAAFPFTPKLLVLTGTLSIGNRTEPDGHISMLRLTLDPPR